jgi:hypothetical protein
METGTVLSFLGQAAYLDLVVAVGLVRGIGG